MADSEVRDIFAALGVTAPADAPSGLVVEDPSRGTTLATLAMDDLEAAKAKVAAAHAAFGSLREVPGPVRGELVRRLGETLRAKKDDLARLVTARGF